MHVENLLTQAEAAEKLGITRQAIHGAISKGLLKVAFRKDHIKLIHPADLEAYRVYVSQRYEKRKILCGKSHSY